MKYVQVENGKLVGHPQDLPINWSNISNFYVLDNQTLKTYGWYPFEEEDSNLQSNEKITGWSINIEEDKVIQRATKRFMTQEEIDVIDTAEITGKWVDIRRKRNQLLLESDWTQIPDSPVQNKTDWQKYRQDLRDLTNNPNPNNVIWPVKPIVVPIPPTPSDNNIPEEGEVVFG